MRRFPRFRATTQVAVQTALREGFRKLTKPRTRVRSEFGPPQGGTADSEKELCVPAGSDRCYDDTNSPKLRESRGNPPPLAKALWLTVEDDASAFLQASRQAAPGACSRTTWWRGLIFLIRSITAARLSPPALSSASVNLPIAKYVSCSRAHPSQKGTPPISTAAGRRQGRAVPLRTWHLPNSLVMSSLTSSPSSIPTLHPLRSPRPNLTRETIKEHPPKGGCSLPYSRKRPEPRRTRYLIEAAAPNPSALQTL